MLLADFAELPIEEQVKRGVVFTPKEIAQQPDTWQTTVEIFQSQQPQICAFLEQAGVRDALEKRPTVFLVGAGTSDYVGRALELLLRQRWGCEVSSVPSTDLLLNLEEYIVPGRKHLCISFSRSGDSPEGVAFIERSLQLYPSIAHLIVTCNAEAAMVSLCKEAELSYAVVLDDAVNDRSLAMTSSFTNMVVLGQCLANAWSFAEYESKVKKLIHAGHGLLPRMAEQAERIALQKYARVCFIGSGALASVARESALKVLEMTAGQVKTMSETILGLRHGPMAALDSETLLVCFLPGEARSRKYALDLLNEITAKQVVAERIVIGPQKAQSETDSLCDLYIPVDLEVEDAYRAIVDVIFGQLLGLYGSVTHELKPDSPSPGGVISRVVKKFRIY